MKFLFLLNSVIVMTFCTHGKKTIATAVTLAKMLNRYRMTLRDDTQVYMLRLATLYLEFEFSANSNITKCRFSVWVLLVAILFIPNLCSMIPQINLIDSCHSNLSR